MPKQRQNKSQSAKNTHKNTNTKLVRSVLVFATLLLLLTLLFLLIPQKALLRTTISGEDVNKLTDGFYDFHIIGIDTFDEKEVIDQTFADVAVENGRYEIAIDLPKYLPSTRVATTVCYSSQGQSQSDGLKGDIDGLGECETLQVRDNIYDQKDCLRILNVIHPNTLFGWLFGWREGIFEEGCGSRTLPAASSRDGRQALSLTGNVLSLSGGNSITLPDITNNSGNTSSFVQSLTTNNSLDCTDCLTTGSNPWVTRADSGPDSSIFANGIADMVGGDGVVTTNDGVGNIAFDVISGVAIDTTGDQVNVRYTGPLFVDGSNQLGLAPCAVNEILQFDGLSWVCIAASSTYDWTLDGDSGTPQLISAGDTATFAGGVGLASLVSAGNILTLDVNPGVAIDTTGDQVNVRYTGPLFVDGLNQLTLGPCAVNEVLQYDGLNWICVNEDTLYSWSLAGDLGPNSTILDTELVTLIGGDGLTTTSDGLDNIDLDINPGIAIDVTGDAVNVRFAGPIVVNGSNQITIQPCLVNEILRFDGVNWVCDPTTFVARDGLINVGTNEDPIIDARANNGLRVDPETEDDSIQLGARFNDPSEKPEANLVFNTEVPQNNFSITWTGTRLTEPNALFGIGTTPGATPDPNSTGLSNLNERLDVIGNIENIADSADPPELVTSSGAGCTSPTNIGENPSQVFSQGRYTYVFIQNDASAGPRQLQIFDNQNPRCARLVNTINLRSGVNNDHIGYVSGHNAYAIDRGGYFMSVDVSNPFPITGFLPPVATQLYNPANFTGTPLSNPVIPTSMHVEGNYAYITLNDPDNGPQDLDYMIVVDISTISSPRLVRTVNLRPSPPNPNPVFNPTSIYIQDRYAYVVGSAGGFGGGLMTIIDISNPRGATIANPNSAAFSLPPSSVPTDVFVQDRYAYVTSAFGAGFAVYDISNPQNLPGIVSAIGGNPSTSVVVSGRYAYTSGSFNVIDVQNPQAANIVSTIAGVSPTAFTINGRFGYYVFDQGIGTPGQFGVLDTHGIETTAILAHAIETGGLQVQTNAVVNNQLQVGGSVTIGDALSVQGDASVAGNFENLSSTRNNPTAIANSTTITIPNTPNETTGMKVVGNYGYVIGRNNSTNVSVLMVYDTTQPNQPRYLSQVTLDNSPAPSAYPRTGERPTAIEVKGRYAYVANSESNTLQTIDITNPNIPTVVSSVAVGTGDPTDIKSIAINDRYMLVMSPPVGSGNSTFNMFDIGNPAAPVNKVSGAIGCIDVSDVYISNNYIYITCADSIGNAGSVIVYDASLTIRSGILTLVGGFAPSLATPLRRPQSIWVQDNRAYVLFSEDNTSFVNLNDYLAVYDVTNPSTATLLGFSQPLGSMGLTQPGSYQNFHGVNLQVSGKYAYIAGFRSSPNPFQNFNEIQLYDISNPTVPADNINSYQDATIRPLGSTRVTNNTSPSLIGSSRVLSISGKYLYSSIHDTTNPITNQLVVYDLHGADIANLLVNNAKIGALKVAGPSEFDGSVNVVNGVSIGQNLSVNGDASFNGDITMIGRQAITSAVGPTATANASRVIKQGDLMYVMRPGSNQISMFRPTYTDFNPFLNSVGTINTGAGMVGIASSGRFIYAVSNNAGVGLLQSFENASPVSAGQVNLPVGFIPASIAMSGKYVYISGFDTGTGSGAILVYDVSAQSSGFAPRAPQLVSTGTYGGITNLTEIKIRDRTLIALEPAAGQIRTFNILNPVISFPPNLLGSVAAPGADRIAVDGDMIYTTSSSLNTLTSYSMPIIGAGIPTALQTLALPGSPTGIRAADRTVYITGGAGIGFRAVDVTNPFTGMQLQPQGSAVPFIDAEVFGRVSVAITQGGGSLQIFNLGSAYIQSLESGEVVTHGLTVLGGRSQTQDLDVNGAFSVNMSSNFRKDVSVYENLNVGLNSTGITTSFTDLFRVSVMGNSQGLGNAAPPFSAIAAITNGNTTDSGANNVLRLNTATVSTGTQSRFVRFFAGVTSDADGVSVGNIRLNNNAVAYTTAGADFAERVDVAEATEAGDIIGVHSGGNRKAVSGDKLIGVVSDTAGFIGNDREGENDTQAIVGMVGQVRTKVSTENGPITKGDLITVSSTAGVGMKANDSAEAVGKAMEDFSCADAQVCQGSIKVYVDPQFYDADILSQADINGLLAINTDTGVGTVESEALDEPAESQGVAATSETSSPRLKDLLTSIQTQVGTQKTSLDALSVQVSQLQAFINSGAISGDVSFGGKVLINGSLTLGGDNAGKSTLPAGQTSIRVNFANPKATVPSIDLQYNPSPTDPPELIDAYLNGDLRMVARDVSTTGFTIQVNSAQLHNLKLNWTAIEQK